MKIFNKMIFALCASLATAAGLTAAWNYGEKSTYFILINDSNQSTTFNVTGNNVDFSKVIAPNSDAKIQIPKDTSITVACKNENGQAAPTIIPTKEIKNNFGVAFSNGKLHLINTKGGRLVINGTDEKLFVTIYGKRKSKSWGIKTSNKNIKKKFELAPNEAKIVNKKFDKKSYREFFAKGNPLGSVSYNFKNMGVRSLTKGESEDSVRLDKNPEKYDYFIINRVNGKLQIRAENK